MDDKQQLIAIIKQALDTINLDTPINEDPDEIPEMIADHIIASGWPIKS